MFGWKKSKTKAVETSLAKVLGQLFDLDVFFIDLVQPEYPVFRSNEIRIGGRYVGRVMYQTYQNNLCVCYSSGDTNFNLTTSEGVYLESYWKAAIERKNKPVDNSPKYKENRDKALEILQIWLESVSRS